MNSKDHEVLLKILKHINAALEYTQDCSGMIAFQSDNMRVEACVFNLMQIGELSKQALSDKAKSELSHIPWKQIYGLRNRIVHGYEGVDLHIVWDTIHEDLPLLADEISNGLRRVLKP